MKKYQLYINGEWREPTSQDYFESFNPYTGQAHCLIPRSNVEDVELAVSAAQQAFTQGEWSQLTATVRGHYLRKLGDLIAERAAELAEIEVKDNGKLFAEMYMQLKYIPQWYYYFAGLADKVEGRVLPSDKPDAFNYTRYEPLGVVVGIVPWNSPLLTATWKIAPALAAGNTFILKPSEHTSVSALALAEIFGQAGFPPGVFNVITGFGHEIGDALVGHPHVAKASFTGGSENGRRVYQTAASGIKPVCLELGGKSPNIVFDDANLDNAVNGVISGIFAASGQTCIAGSRLLLQKTIYHDFIIRLLDVAKTAKLGDPMQTDTNVGPVATITQYEKILEYIDIAKAEGAKTELGGKKATDYGDGWFVEPTIFSDVDNKMRIAQEEVFGPILSVIPFADVDDAITIANDSIYGLAAGLWTTDNHKIFQISEALSAGTIWVNTYRMFSYMTPFGGYKQSGLGRESGQSAIYDFMQCKSIWISHAEVSPNPFVMR